MISVIIAVYNEENLIIQNLQSIYKQISVLPDFEIVVVASGCTDNTVDMIKFLKREMKSIILVEERNRNGKASAINIAHNRVRGDICILMDGDVFLGRNSIIELIKPFKDKSINLSCSRVIPRKYKNVFNQIASIRCEVWHDYRLSQSEKALPLIPSGYLYAIRSRNLPDIPNNIINDDQYIGLVQSDGAYKSVYSQNSIIYPIYPKTFDDYIKQRLRTQLGRIQLERVFGSQIQKDFLSFSTKKTFITNVEKKPYAILNLLLELYVRNECKSIYENKRINRCYIWEPIQSTKCL
ncbi:MAG: glycosyltransferase [Anaerolineae bacterium]|nr:glycosyltransferase [Anaerolineae bacterium]